MGGGTPNRSHHNQYAPSATCRSAQMGDIDETAGFQARGSAIRRPRSLWRIRAVGSANLLSPMGGCLDDDCPSLPRPYREGRIVPALSGHRPGSLSEAIRLAYFGRMRNCGSEPTLVCFPAGCESEGGQSPRRKFVTPPIRPSTVPTMKPPPPAKPTIEKRIARGLPRDFFRWRMSHPATIARTPEITDTTPTMSR